ncbi:MAG: FAD-dependent oxidoreductase [Methylobacillus sp.]|jgi:glycine oxidase|nr:FAD-dependent oxidoreductase [Methylobacillus sp.]
MKPTITIIGAGAVGCLTALTFAKHGWNVTLIDKNRLGGEASWAGGGILFPLLPWNYPDEINDFAFAGASRYAALCDELREATGIDPEYNVCGMRIFPEFDARAPAWCAARGIPAELHNETLFLPQVAQARNPRLLAALKARLLALGVTLHEHTELLPLQNEAGRITAWQSKDGRSFGADIYVLAAGAWSAPLLGKSAAAIPVKPMRGQMLLYKLSSPAFTEILYREDFYLVPRRDGHVLAGSTIEDVGYDKSATPEAAANLARKAAALHPALKNAPILQHWSGLRPGSPGNIPLINRHAGFDNLYLNTGHFRYGVTMAPVSAERVFGMVTTAG